MNPSPRTVPLFKRAGAFSHRPAEPEPFDALTDLFLGEVAGALTSPRASASPEPALPDERVDATKSTEVAAASPRPMLRLAPVQDTDDADAVEQADHAESVQVINEAMTPSGPLPPPARRPVIECLLLGNLPVLASAWASQFVREVASAAQRPVAVVRVQNGCASVELVGELPAWVGQMGDHPADTLEAALDAAALVTDRWVIRCEPGQERALLQLGLARVVTVLTGTDEAASAGADALLSTLGELAPTISKTGALVRVALMGADDQRARTVGSRLASRASDLLDQEVAFTACSNQIHATRPARALFSGPAQTDIERLADLLARTLGPTTEVRTAFAAPNADFAAAAETVEPVERVHADPVGEDAPTVEETVAPPAPVNTPSMVRLVPMPPEADAGPLPERTLEHSDELASVVLPDVPEDDARAPEPVAVPLLTPWARRGTPTIEAKPSVLDELPAPAPLARITPQGAAPVTPTPTTEVAASASTPTTPAARTGESTRASSDVTPAQARPAALSELLDGLTHLNVTCPYAQDVEIAIDNRGGLAVLARTTDTDDAHAADEAVAGTLLVAASWARLNASLLRRQPTTAGTRSVTNDEPSMHLFTGRPKRARKLLDTGVRVHLLGTVLVDGKAAWYTVELN